MNGKQAWKWYVYELVDPRDGEAFYVGKGCGSRIDAHEREARSAGDICSEKISKIKDIWAAEENVVKRHVAFFNQEQDAYDYEAERVAGYGLELLTNIAPGGGGCRGYVITRPKKPATPVELARMLSRSVATLRWLGVYLHATLTGKAITIESRGLPQVYLDITRVLVESLLPKWWKEIKADQDAMRILAPAMLAAHSMESVHGCA